MAVPIKVYLRPDEYATALDVATRRVSDSLLNKSRDSLHDKPFIEGTVKHIMGACAEVAASKALDRYPQLGVRQYTGMAADVSSDIEVRYSTRGELVVRPRDLDNRKYVLVTGSPPNLTIEGWLTKEEAVKLGKYIDVGNKGKPAWFVSTDKLRDMQELKNIKGQ